MISLYILIGLIAFLALVWTLRTDRVSLGLPIAYLALLLLNHLPGAYAHAVSSGQPLGGEFIERPDAYGHTFNGKLFGTEVIEAGLGLTVAGAVCFVLGVALARALTKRAAIREVSHRPQFALFCLLGGWFLIYGLTPLREIPSVGAAIVNGGAIWIFGVVLGLRSAFSRKDRAEGALWIAALMVYPVIMLVLGGFLSYGSAAIVTAVSVLAVTTRRSWRVLVGLAVTVFVCMNIFVNYFQTRDEIRRATWGGGTVAERIDANLGMVRNFRFFDSENPNHLRALDQRLNQNYFVGLAAKRLNAGYVDYVKGRSVSEALLSLVPRAVWPDKPVFGGSPKIVSEMTGLRLNQGTSWGVGQVMEFYINFGLPGVVLGFLGLGWLLGWIDAKAASAEARGDLGRAIVFFLPGVALLQPIGSLVELSGSAAAALAAAVAWRWAWAQLTARKMASGRRAARAARAAR